MTPTSNARGRPLPPTPHFWEQVADSGVGAVAGVSVTVTYELTDLGLSLYDLVRGLESWAETHMDDVLAHRAAHDDRTA